MSTSARKSPATKSLLRHIASRDTGRLSLDTVDGPLELYLMSGELVGAVHPHDDAAMVRRVGLSDALPPERIAGLMRLISSRQSVFGPLLDQVPTEVIEPILSDRFRENIICWVSQDIAGTFEALPGVFVDNMQMGHNTIQVVERCCVLSDLAFSYDADTEVVRGPRSSDDALEAWFLDATSDDPVTVEALILHAHAEPITARACVARMIDEGLLMESGLELMELHTDEVEALNTGESEPDDEEDDSDQPTVRAVNELAELPPPPPISSLKAPVAPPLDEADTLDESDPLHEPVPDDTQEGEVSPGENLAEWLHTSDLDEEDMAFFEDNEDDRGQGQGTFSTESHNLEKVEVAPRGEAPEPPPAEEAIEVGEAPTARFSAPVLSEDDAAQKIDVFNDALQKIALAFDDSEGAGRGQAVVQLLLDGCPPKYSVVFHGLAIGRDGSVPAYEVLDNLTSRPATEHRQLLNNALKDAIDRGLSAAADELPDDAFDDLYESVAGYNQRLGL